MACKRSAVRSRLAPPRFAFGYAWRSRVSRRRSVVSGEACRAKTDGLNPSQIYSAASRIASGATTGILASQSSRKCFNHARSATSCNAR
ncbi:MAG: hypothetical protein JWR77_2520 [Rhizorhabdus sp.]|nr:hypothetical protein [Rhizorhabdus sp.]